MNKILNFLLVVFLLSSSNSANAGIKVEDSGYKALEKMKVKLSDSELDEEIEGGDELKPFYIPSKGQVRRERYNYHKSIFKNMLRREYIKLAERLTAHKNWTDATHFRRKGIKAKEITKDFLPEDPKDWQIENDYFLSELLNARLDLINALDARVVTLVPNATAKAIVYYDCWIQQTQNQWQNDETDCKKAYMDVYGYVRQAHDEIKSKTLVELIDTYKLIDVEANYWPYKDMVDDEPYEGDYAKEHKKVVNDVLEAEEKRKQKEAEEAQAKAASNRNAEDNFIIDQTDENSTEVVYLVYFNQSSSSLSNAAKEEINRAADQIKKAEPKTVIINGHTDRALSNNESLIVSKQRADAARDHLVNLGISRSIIRTYGFGKTDNAVANEEGEPEPKNRRAEILFRLKNN